MSPLGWSLQRYFIRFVFTKAFLQKNESEISTPMNNFVLKLVDQLFKPTINTKLHRNGTPQNLISQAFTRIHFIQDVKTNNCLCDLVLTGTDIEVYYTTSKRLLNHTTYLLLLVLDGATSNYMGYQVKDSEFFLNIEIVGWIPRT